MKQQHAAHAVIIAIIVLVSGLRGSRREKWASDGVKKALPIVRVRAAVRRDRRGRKISEEVVPGDVVILKAEV